MRWDRGILAASVRAGPLPLTATPGDLLEALAAAEEGVLLESSALHEDYGRYSLLACCPLDVLTLGSDGVLRARDGRALNDGHFRSIWKPLEEAFAAVRLTGDVAWASRPCVAGPSRPCAQERDARGTHGQARGAPDGDARAMPYLPGWIGYVGYEVGRHAEKLPGRAPRDTALPDLRLAFYDAVLLYDALERTWTLVELAFEDPPPGAGRGAAALRRLAVAACDQPAPPPRPTDSADAACRQAAPAAANFTPADYRRSVARCVEYIAAGDIFQVNLSQRFEVADAPSPLEIYRSLRRRNPAWHAAYLAFAGGEGQRLAVLSSSPELFLRVRGRHVLTRPIKGTRRRTGDEQADQAARRDLLTSAKDNAELAMIIDLLRNDLGRVCRFGSVRVSEPRRLETHPTVFHLVGSVEGELCDDVGPARLLRATFPGGSITGAPKIRAMEIIDELEPQARGVYTGCIGIVCVDGSCEWNIAIRTVVYQDARALVQAGGGILADSDPQGEYNETLDKARAVLEAIQQARQRD